MRITNRADKVAQVSRLACHREDSAANHKLKIASRETCATLKIASKHQDQSGSMYIQSLSLYHASSVSLSCRAHNFRVGRPNHLVCVIYHAPVIIYNWLYRANCINNGSIYGTAKRRTKSYAYVNFAIVSCWMANKMLSCSETKITKTA